MKKNVEDFAVAIRERAPTAGEQVLDLCSHGEWGIAFENLLSNLHEEDVLLTEAELVEAEAITRRLGQSLMQVEALRGLGTDENGRRLAVVFTGLYCRTSVDLHEFLQGAFGFPDFYGRNWDAFWDAIVGLVEMPRVVYLLNGPGSPRQPGLTKRGLHRRSVCDLWLGWPTG